MFSLLLELTKTLKFSQDNPGGSWLSGKKADIAERGLDSYGAPKTYGPITGYFNRSLLLPVKLVKDLKGFRGEQKNVRNDSISYLEKVMGETHKLPIEHGRQYAPFIMVMHDGQAWVNEGNHRIMVAAKLGWEYIPIELKYYVGGEDEASTFNPSKLKAYDAQALQAGYDADDFTAFPNP